MRFIRRLGAGGLALTAAVALGACGSSSSSSGTTTSGGTTLPGTGKPAITLGDKNFTEELILGQLYAQALRSKGFTVNLKENLGATELVDKLLTSGQIDMYPEYTGTILAVIANQKTPPKTAAAAYAQAKAFEQTRGFTLLAATPFYDSDALATLPAYAKAHSLKTIADLKPLGKKVRLIAAPEFATRTEGLVGLKQVYGINPTFKPLSIGLTYTALDSGDADVADVFTTDAQLVGGKYVLLSDPKFVFGFQNVAPVVSQKVLSAEGPAFAQTLNAVSATLTTKAVQTMNAAVSVDKQTAKSVAKTFLAANGLG
ncbi:MAG TPA: glycine betaine ABC transporter substrate-binding protein [Solirubrobacteraceae bacterium]